MERWIQRLKLTLPSVGSSRGWTCVLFPSAMLLRWLCRSFGKVSHRLTQILTGYGCFDRICHVSSHLCGVLEEEGTAAFDGERAVLVRQIGAFIPKDLFSKILESPSTWTAVAKFAEAIMSRKKQAGRVQDHREGLNHSHTRS